MPLNSSGPISLNGATTGQSASIEIGLGAGVQIDMLGSQIRTLTGIASGAIRLPDDFYGKSFRAIISSVFSTNTLNATLDVTAISGYRAGQSDITVTVNSGVYLWSDSTATPGLTLTGGTTGDTVKIVNNGFIMGKGGTGGVGLGYVGGAGGPALKLGYNTTIDNTNASAYIGGGGGGGGAYNNQHGGGGGGAGGGDGSQGQQTGAEVSTHEFAGGAGGAIGSVGANGATGNGVAGGSGGGAGGGGGTSYSMGSGKFSSLFAWGGGGGGRIFPGTGGAGQPAGGGYAGTAGGAGNAAGTSVNVPATTGSSAGGGGWGASGGSSVGAGGAGGKAVNLNGYSVTWVSSDTTRVYGSVSS
jgi:hypothetical protein